MLTMMLTITFLFVVALAETSFYEDLGVGVLPKKPKRKIPFRSYAASL